MGNSFSRTVAGLFVRDQMNHSTMLSGHVGAIQEYAQASDSRAAWFNGLAAVNQPAQASSKRWVVTYDCKRDICEFFQTPQESNVDLLVRVFQPRQATLALARLIGLALRLSSNPGQVSKY